MVLLLLCPFYVFVSILKLLALDQSQKRLVVLNILCASMASTGEAVLVEKWFDSEAEVSKEEKSFPVQ